VFLPGFWAVKDWGFLGPGKSVQVRLSLRVKEVSEVGWSQDFRLGGRESSVFFTPIWVLPFSIPGSWAGASVLFFLKSKGKSSVLVASFLSRFEAAFRFRLPVLVFLVFLRRLSVSAAADVRI